MEAGCGNTIAVCAHEDIGRLNNPAADEAFHAVTQTYDLPAVHPQTATPWRMSRLAPEAGYLLTTAFPPLTVDQAIQIPTETDGPGGGFPDDGSAFKVYSRLNLYAAAVRTEHVASARQ